MAIVGLAALMVVVAVEVVCAIAFTVVNGELIYVRQPPPGDRADADSITDPGKPRKILHPVLGFVNRPGIEIRDLVRSERTLREMGGPDAPPGWDRARANADGFLSPVDYPWGGVGEDDFIIGVFGGSVAQWFALRAGEDLASRLEQLEGLEGRPVRVLSFGQGALKHPQQLQALSFYASMGQRFDLVLDLSGFNEVALSAFNTAAGIEGGWPSYMQLGPIMRLVELEAAPTETLSLMARIRSDRIRLVELQSGVDQGRVATLWLIRSLRLRLLENRFDADQAELARMAPEGDFKWMALRRLEGEVTVEDACREAAIQWRRGVSMMSAICENIGAGFVAVLQPNQYHTGHRFSPEEGSLALNPDSVFREPVQIGYPFLRSALEDLRKEGVLAIDAVDVFDSVSQPVYADDCCHLNELGNRLLAERIVEEIGPVVREQASRRTVR
jgi:hypothetical protein